MIKYGVGALFPCMPIWPRLTRSERGCMNGHPGVVPGVRARLDALPMPSWTDICALPGERQASCDVFAEYKEGDT